VWDVDYKDGKVTESEIVFFAADKDGNVWLWVAGLNIRRCDFKGGSGLDRRHGWLKSGDHDEGRPAAGDTSYSQG